MKTVTRKENLSNLKKALGLAVALFPIFVQGQNLVTNSDFSTGTTGWTSGCSVEVNPETVYGGFNGANPVTEIDFERCLNQTICIFPGSTYTLTYKGTRRIASNTPATVGVTALVTGVTSGTVYINQNNNYTNISFGYTTSTYTFTVPSGSTDRQVRLRIQSLNSTATYGAILDDIQLQPQTAMTINGTNLATQNSTYSYSVANCPGSVASYNWSFGANATTATSTSATPSTSWTATGAKNVTVALSNSTCGISLNMSVAVTGVLPVTFTSFTGALNNNKTVLNFSTSDELNAKCFMVEKSIDGRTFDSVGRIQASNTPGKHNYSFVETNYAGTAWYRIREIDYSGSYSFSSIVVLKSTGNANKLMVFPSQVTSSVQYVINSAQASGAVVQVIDMTGKQHIISKHVLTAGTSQHSLNVASLTPGVYFLKVLGSGSEIAAKQFQKL